MSRAYDDHMETVNAERERAYVAGQLGIDPDMLDEHPYTLDYATTNDGGIVTAWLLNWDDDAPEGVNAEGNSGSLWTSIAPDYSDDSDRQSDDE
ncbi:hypothetical protein [Sphingomonas endolithica]|uniref:hypothetical protein n=1 Tax=Sphingomonas endolithica TaxID=2972485 RepID=UPI0021AFC9FD|nr:hypothetical protein [Sphingomonas sp. ZFBP2030]